MCVHTCVFMYIIGRIFVAKMSSKAVLLILLIATVVVNANYYATLVDNV